MSKDIGELIIGRSINICCQPIFSYILSLVFARKMPSFPRGCHICVSQHTNKTKRLREQMNSFWQYWIKNGEEFF